MVGLILHSRGFMCLLHCSCWPITINCTRGFMCLLHCSCWPITINQGRLDIALKRFYVFAALFLLANNNWIQCLLHCSRWPITINCTRGFMCLLHCSCWPITINQGRIDIALKRFHVFAAIEVLCVCCNRGFMCLLHSRVIIKAISLSTVRTMTIPRMKTLELKKPNKGLVSLVFYVSIL